VKNSSETWTALSTDDAKVYFNRAHRDCGTDVRFVVETASTAASTKISNLLSANGVDGQARLYLGQSGLLPHRRFRSWTGPPIARVCWLSFEVREVCNIRSASSVYFPRLHPSC
jgi:hypothetical protein